MARVFKGKVFDVEAGLTRLPNGRRVYREFIVHPGAVVIIPFVSKENILIIRQYRPAVSSWLLELPAGTLEPGEEPLETAYRELEEETGYKAGEMEYLGFFYTSPGISTEVMHVFLARKLEKTVSKLEEDELIEVIEVGLDDVYNMVTKGDIRDGKTIAALMIYHLHANRD